MAKYDVIERMMQSFEIQTPEHISVKFDAAISPHLEEIQRVLSDCRAFMDHYQFLVNNGEMHPESAVELIKHSDLLRFHLIEPIADLESLIVMAEYVSLNAAEGRTVELKRKQAEVWIQPFRRIHRILKEYAEWLDRVSFTLRSVARRGD